MSLIKSLTFERVSVCNICNRAVCVKPKEHLRLHKINSKGISRENHFIHNSVGYHEAMFDAIVKYKTITGQDDITESFIQNDIVLYDLFLYNQIFDNVGFSVVNSRFSYNATEFNDCKLILYKCKKKT